MMDLPRRQAALALAAPLLIPGILAGCASSRAVTLPHARQRDIRSAGNGRIYRIFIFEPSGPAPAGGWPVLFVLDGNALFPVATTLTRSLAQRGATPVVVVGIGHDGEPLFDDKGRMQDFPPERGGDAFLDLLEKQVVPLLPQEAASDRAQWSLFGHSLGGLLVLHALFTRPGLVGNFHAASASIWWNKGAILNERDQWLARKRLTSARLHLMVGGLEQSSADPERGAVLRQRRQIDNARELSASLHGANGLQVTLTELPGETHGSAVVPALQRTVIAIQGPI